MPSADHSSLESILLMRDRRQMSALRSFLPPHYCTRAARLAQTHRQRVLIVTGFYLAHLQAPETDGPPGALAVGHALAQLGAQVTYVTDRYTLDLMCRLADSAQQVIEFPITGPQESEAFTRVLLDRVRPTLLVSVERCGITAAGDYVNARGRAINEFTARLDTLFQHGIPSIGIGDGGNEIGMGKLAAVIPTIDGLPAQPCVTITDELIIAGASNWGAYALCAALSALTRNRLLPDPLAEEQLLYRLFDMGCYDGTRDTPQCGIDGFTPADNSAVLKALSVWLRAHT